MPESETDWKITMRDFGLTFAPGGEREPQFFAQNGNNNGEANHRFQYRKRNAMNTNVEVSKSNHVNGVTAQATAASGDSAKDLAAAIGGLSKEMHEANARNVRTVKAEAFDGVSLSLKAMLVTAAGYLTYRGIRSLLPTL